MADRKYDFTLIFTGADDLTTEVEDRLYEAGLDDALVGMRGGLLHADFTREAPSFEDAVAAAVRDVETAGFPVSHVEPDDLVTMSEIARRLERSREGVRLIAAGRRGPGGFPVPAAGLTRRSPLWRWTDVARWAAAHHWLPQAASAGHADAVAAINAALALRRYRSPAAAHSLLRKLGRPLAAS